MPHRVKLSLVDHDRVKGGRAANSFILPWERTREFGQQRLMLRSFNADFLCAAISSCSFMSAVGRSPDHPPPALHVAHEDAAQQIIFGLLNSCPIFRSSRLVHTCLLQFHGVLRRTVFHAVSKSSPLSDTACRPALCRGVPPIVREGAAHQRRRSRCTLFLSGEELFQSVCWPLSDEERSCRASNLRFSALL